MILITDFASPVECELLNCLVRNGENVRVLMHDRPSARHLCGAQVAIGALNKLDSLAPAMEGIRAVFVSATDREALRNVFIAAKEADVQYLIIKQSTIETEFLAKAGKWPPSEEETIRESGVTWTVIRTSMIIDDLVGLILHGMRGDATVEFSGGSGKIAPIDPKDVAAVAASMFRQDVLHKNQIYDLTGPEMITISEMVHTLGEFLHIPLRYVDVPDSAILEKLLGAGLPTRMLGCMAETLIALRQNRFARVTGFVEEISGRVPRSFESWCRDYTTAFE